jgi:hypothetical protein
MTDIYCTGHKLAYNLEDYLSPGSVPDGGRVRKSNYIINKDSVGT